ncbi:MAG: GNAT family N-acetyltransferase [Acidimicrobiales bacterium]
MGYELRPIAPDEFDIFMRRGTTAFGEDDTPELREHDRRFFEFDRSLAAFDGGELVATAGAFTFDLTLPGLTTIPVAGVTWVTVLPTHRRRGLLRQLMDRQLDDFAARNEPVAVLEASESTIYGRFGYGIATQAAKVEIRKESTSLAIPSRAGGRIRLLDPDDAHKVLPGVYDAHRRSLPGALTRNERWWESYFTDPEKLRDGYSVRYDAVHENDAGEADGYAAYRISWNTPAADTLGSTLRLLSLHSADPEVDAALFEYLLNVDLVGQIESHVRPVDDPLRWRLVDIRRYRMSDVRDWLWVRLLDIPAALGARRYGLEGRLTLEVRDPFRPANDGVYRLDGGPGGATCTRVAGDDADIRLPVDALGAVYLGGVSFSTLAVSGRLTGSPEVLARADAMFRSTPPPFCDRSF